MHEQLFYDINRQKHHDDVVRSESNLKLRSAVGHEMGNTRARIALALVTLAARLQPSLTIQVQASTRPATA